MSKGPRVHPDIEKHILTLVTDNPHLKGKEIQAKLEQEFMGTSIPIPAIRTTQDRAKQIIDQLTIEEKPWSLAIMAKGDIDIPWEAVGFLLWAFAELRHLQKSGEKIWRWSEHPLDDFYEGGVSVEEVMESLGTGRELEHVSVKPLAPRAPVGTILTNRQAKWLWRLHLMFPKLKPTDLFYHADAYAQKEILTDYLGWDFDTSDLDGSLINLLRSIKDRGISVKKEKKNQITKKGE